MASEPLPTTDKKIGISAGLRDSGLWLLVSFVSLLYGWVKVWILSTQFVQGFCCYIASLIVALPNSTSVMVLPPLLYVSGHLLAHQQMGLDSEIGTPVQ